MAIGDDADDGEVRRSLGLKTEEMMELGGN